MDLSTVTYYFTRYGAIAIFVIVFLEYLNLPGFPAGIIMPLSGIMAAKGNIPFVWVMVITVAAGLLGSFRSISDGDFSYRGREYDWHWDDKDIPEEITIPRWPTGQRQCQGLIRLLAPATLL